MEVLSREVWSQKMAEHQREVLPFTAAYRRRKMKGESHPVYDFLFTYYTYSTRKLEQWHPGVGVRLESVANWESFFNPAHYQCHEGWIQLGSPSEKQLAFVHRVSELFDAIDSRPTRFSCFGLHEWAMVYRSEEVRHSSWPLRLSPVEIARVCEEQTICCSHFDAFRFFTDAARPLNVLRPADNTRLNFEQGGCLHVNMDLYKWAYKLSPLISGDLLRSCFLLAVKTREVDMRASPYNLESLGFSPIEIETAAGREEYVAYQQEIARMGQELRGRFRQELFSL
jgi:hypothetical protein